MRPDSERRHSGEQPRNRQPLTRYDAVLTLLPVAFLLTVGAAELVGVSTRAALASWSVVGIVTLVDALFLNPPTTGRRQG